MASPREQVYPSRKLTAERCAPCRQKFAPSQGEKIDEANTLRHINRLNRAHGATVVVTAPGPSGGRGYVREKLDELDRNPHLCTQKRESLYWSNCSCQKLIFHSAMIPTTPSASYSCHASRKASNESSLEGNARSTTSWGSAPLVSNVLNLRAKALWSWGSRALELSTYHSVYDCERPLPSLCFRRANMLRGCALLRPVCYY